MRDPPGEDVGVLLDLPQVHLPPVRAVGRHPLRSRVQTAGGGVRTARGPDQDGGVAAAAASHGAHQPRPGSGQYREERGKQEGGGCLQSMAVFGKLMLGCVVRGEFPQLGMLVR